MNRILCSLAAAGMLAAATVAAPSAASAQCRGCGVAAGVIGGLAAGAIIGGAIANAPPPYYYGPPPGPVYVAPGPYTGYEPGCYWTRGAARWDGYGWVYPHVQVCP
jgi:hypothetical protein